MTAALPARLVEQGGDMALLSFDARPLNGSSVEMRALTIERRAEQSVDVTIAFALEGDPPDSSDARRVHLFLDCGR